jgi:hypothetical protein
MKKVNEVNDAFVWFGSKEKPGICSNCINFDGYCEIGHRTKDIAVLTGHIERVYVRKKNGCEDHEIKAGLLYAELLPGKTGGDYGGISTSLL